jgi:Na+-driven multidrug efflux pump
MNVLICLFIYLGRSLIANLFTNQQDLIELIEESIGIMGLVIIIHGASMVLGGAMRGIGM